MGSLKPDAPRAIYLTPEEKATGKLSPANLCSALEGLNQDGLLVLKRVINVDHIDKLNTFMVNESRTILEKKSKTNNFNQGVQCRSKVFHAHRRYRIDRIRTDMHVSTANILHGPPVCNPDLLFDDVYFNPFIIQIANSWVLQWIMLNTWSSSIPLDTLENDRSPTL